MKILLVNNSHLPMIGGKEIVVHHLARQFQNKGHDVRLAGPSGWWRHRNHDFGYPVERYPSLPLLKEDGQWRVRSVLMLLRKKYDVIHAHTTYPCAYSMHRAMNLLGQNIPLVVTPHGADIHKAPEVNFGKRLDPVLDEKIGESLRTCDRATAISDSVHNSLLDAGCLEAKIVDIANGVDTQRFSRISSLDARRELKISKDARLIVSTGNYHPRKGHEVLIEALQLLENKDVHLCIVGRRCEDLVQRVGESPVAEQVTFLGAVSFPLPGQDESPDLVAALLQQADIYISASKGEGTEGLSLAVLEAMAAECCVIATDVSGNRDIIEDSVNGRLVASNSATALSRAIDQTLADELTRKSLAGKGLQAVKPMSWSAIADRYLELFTETIQ